MIGDRIDGCMHAWVSGESGLMDDVDVPSWKGRRGRLATTAREERKKTLDAIFRKGEESLASCW